MRILGIDPGVAIVGFGLIETERSAVRMLQYGAINTSAGLPLATRLVQIEQDLTQLIRQFQFMDTCTSYKCRIRCSKIINLLIGICKKLHAYSSNWI